MLSRVALSCLLASAPIIEKIISSNPAGKHKYAGGCVKAVTTRIMPAAASIADIVRQNTYCFLLIGFLLCVVLLLVCRGLLVWLVGFRES